MNLREIFELLREPELKARYNIAPTQSVAVIRSATGGRDLTLMHWGLIPSWSKDPKMGSRMINARAESVATKPAFRSAFKQRRCLIPADGFFERRKTGTKKQPYLIGLRSGEPFAFAGLWEHWRGEDVEIESCTIIIGEPNELAAQVRDRMPVILKLEDYDRWLENPDAESLLVPYPAEVMAMRSVSTRVNSPRNDDSECIEGLAE